MDIVPDNGWKRHIGKSDKEGKSMFFEEILSAVDKLTPEQIDVLRKKIDNRLTRFATPFSEEEIARDVEEAIQAVGVKNRKKEYEFVTCDVCGKTQKVDVITI